MSAELEHVITNVAIIILAISIIVMNLTIRRR